MHENTRTMRVMVLGPEHPAVAATLVNMGLVHQKMKNYDDARQVFERAIEIYELYPVTTHDGVQPHPEIPTIRGYLKALQEQLDAADMLDGSDSASHHSERSQDEASAVSSIKVLQAPIAHNHVAINELKLFPCVLEPVVFAARREYT